MDTLEQAIKGNLNAISKHICICLLYQYHAEIQAGLTDPRFKAAKEAQEIQNHGSPATSSHALYRPKKPRGQSLG